MRKKWKNPCMTVIYGLAVKLNINEHKRKRKQDNPKSCKEI